jgi:hypothetical protein
LRLTHGRVMKQTSEQIAELSTSREWACPEISSLDRAKSKCS